MIAAGADVCLGFGAMTGPNALTTAARETGVPTYERASHPQACGG